MDKTIDARGLACPQPTVLTKALVERGEKAFEIIVDNDVAKENIERVAAREGYKIKETREGTDIWVQMIKQDQHDDIVKETPQEQTEAPKTCSFEVAAPTVIVINAGFIGSDDELGSILMKGFLYSLTEVSPQPQAIILMHSAVKLAVSGSDHLENLEILGKQGIDILVCAMCLDYYGLKGQAALGTTSNMYDIVMHMINAGHIISL